MAQSVGRCLVTSGQVPLRRIESQGAKLLTSQITSIHFPLEEFNHGAQLVAIRRLLYRQRRADRELSDRLEEADGVARRTRGRANEHAVDAWVELAEMSCYQDAAHSMAAVGMIAPLIESAFRAALRSIESNLPQWGLAENIVKRVAETGMKEYMPADLDQMLSALFAYRNKMFHGGFEWSSEELRKFERDLDGNGWPSDWFSTATSNGKPWMFYMTSAFVDHCLDMAERIIGGIQQFCWNRSLGLVAKQKGRRS